MRIIVSKEDQKQARKRRNSIGEGRISQNKEKSRKRRLSIDEETVLGESRKRAVFEEKTISHLSQFPYSTKLSEPIHRNPQQSDREEKRT